MNGIFTLSQHPSWRLRGLEAAANLIEPQLDVPPQAPVLDLLPIPGIDSPWLIEYVDYSLSIYVW